MDTVLRLAALCLLGALLAVLLRRGGGELALLLVLAVCGVAVALCRDAGEGDLASVLETAGAVAAIVVSLPLFRAVWDLLESLL